MVHIGSQGSLRLRLQVPHGKMWVMFSVSFISVRDEFLTVVRDPIS